MLSTSGVSASQLQLSNGNITGGGKGIQMLVVGEKVQYEIIKKEQ